MTNSLHRVWQLGHVFHFLPVLAGLAVFAGGCGKGGSTGQGPASQNQNASEVKSAPVQRQSMTMPDDRFVIPLSALQPKWDQWRKLEVSGSMGFLAFRKPDGSGEIGWGMHKDTHVNRLEIEGDEIGMIPPTKDGSIVFFMSAPAGVPFQWVNDISITTTGKLCFQVLEGKGLVHISGHGTCRVAGKETTLRE